VLSGARQGFEARGGMLGTGRGAIVGEAPKVFVSMEGLEGIAKSSVCCCREGGASSCELWNSEFDNENAARSAHGVKRDP